MTDIDLDRLQATLLTSGIQTTNNPLFQVITQLIRANKELKNIINNLSQNVTNNITNVTNVGNDKIILIPGFDDSSGGDYEMDIRPGGTGISIVITAADLATMNATFMNGLLTNFS